MTSDDLIRGIKHCITDLRNLDSSVAHDEANDLQRRLNEIQNSKPGTYTDDLRQLLYYADYRRSVTTAYES